MTPGEAREALNDPTVQRLFEYMFRRLDDELRHGAIVTPPSYAYIRDALLDGTLANKLCHCESCCDTTGTERNEFADDGEPDDDRAMTKRLLTKPEVAHYLGCTERHVSNLVARGHLTAIYVGRAVRFHPDDIPTAQPAEAPEGG